MSPTSSEPPPRKNPGIVTLSMAELSVASIVMFYGAIFIILSLFHVHTVPELHSTPGLGFFLSLGWLFVSWRLHQSADLSRDIRQRRRYVLFWTCYSVMLLLFNIGVIILFVVVLIKEEYYFHHSSDALIAALVVSVIILLGRGFIFFSVFHYSRELLHEAPESENPEDREQSQKLTTIPEEETSKETDLDHDSNQNKYENGTHPENDLQTRTVVVTAV